MDAHNSFAQPQAVVPAPYAAAPRDGTLTLDLPPKSIVVVTSMP
jgi:alpha-N-arabinofuranosidase